MNNNSKDQPQQSPGKYVPFERLKKHTQDMIDAGVIPSARQSPGGSVCPACGGDGKETCDNPDHRLSFCCPGCGHDPDHKVIGGGKCPECEGTGERTEPARPEAPAYIPAKVLVGEDGKPVMLRTGGDFDAIAEKAAASAGRLMAALKETPEAPEIPVGVYYNAEHRNFYDSKTRVGMGDAFYTQWRHNRDEFPSEPQPPAPGESIPDKTD